jgi:hypothetical protein
VVSLRSLSERYVRGFCLIDLHSPLLSPVLNTAHCARDLEGGQKLCWDQGES